MILGIESTGIRSALMLAGIPEKGIFLADGDYALTTPDYIQGPFAKEFTGILDQSGFRYSEERRDCDDFARWAAAWASLFHAATPDSPPFGLAFGEAWCYRLQHAFNLAVHRKDNEFWVAAYEPQPGQMGFSFETIPLEPDDYSSIYLCKF